MGAHVVDRPFIISVQTLLELESIKETLKMQKADVKAAEKKLTKLEEKKAKADIAAEAEAKKIQAQEMINQLLANGMSADEILEKLK